MGEVTKNGKVPAIRVVIEAINGTITTRETYIIETSNSEPAISSHIHKILLLPSLQSKVQKLKISQKERLGLLLIMNRSSKRSFIP